MALLPWASILRSARDERPAVELGCTASMACVIELLLSWKCICLYGVSSDTCCRPSPPSISKARCGPLSKERMHNRDQVYCLNDSSYASPHCVPQGAKVARGLQS